MSNIRNYTSSVPADKSILDIERCLISMGARNIAKEYDGFGKVDAADGLKNVNTIMFGSIPESSVLMQFTGRRENEAAWIESNFGKDIYEGDIVKCWVSRYPDDKTTGYIEYNPHAQAFQVRYKNIYNEYVNEFMHHYHFFEIIGNIYQHKHLLS